MAASCGLGAQRQKLPLWPEWNDGEVNAEKWEAPHKGKEKDKLKSPVVQHYFDDPEGRVDLPPSIQVTSWKRPTDYIFDKAPTVVDQDEGLNGFDLLKSNAHLTSSELMRWVISQVTALWDIGKVHNPPPETMDETYQTHTYTWKPWEHIYAQKVVKGPFIPAYNPYGKYAVRLYWMGCWRKIIVDDSMPFDENDQCLFPMTSLEHELWPMLLTKALCKIASLDYGGGRDNNCEFGDVSLIQCLTGWLPEAVPLHYGHMQQVWDILKDVLPEWKLTEPEPDEPAEGPTEQGPEAQEAKEENKELKTDKDVKIPAKDSKPKGKDDRKKEKSTDCDSA